MKEARLDNELERIYEEISFLWEDDLLFGRFRVLSWNINMEHTLTFILTYRTILSIGLILMLFAVFFLVPGWAVVTAGIVFSLSVGMTIFSIVQKQRNLYREKPTNGIKLARNVLFEIMGILVAMILAGLLGRHMAQIVTQQISNDLIKFTASIATGLLVGIGAGIVMQRIWGRFIKTSAGN